jgi:osmoprotectant transport system permease protein
MSEQLALLPGYLTAHLQLTLFALVVGIALSIPLGILAARVRWLEHAVLGAASVIQTIPSLALLAVMVPLLAGLGMRGIGFLPAFIGLTLYSLLPILRNTVTGLSGVDPAVIEAARGVGMTPMQSLRRVELPLAMPTILAGIRVATVLTVGVATLSTPVGAPSLGNYIFSGLQLRDYTAVLVGSVSAAVLALCLDGLVRSLGAAVTERKTGRTAVVLTTIGLLFAFTAVTFVREVRARDTARVVIGAKTFTEQYILSQILAKHIEGATGIATSVVSSLGSTVAFDALRANDLDVYVDYSGTIWATVMHKGAAGASREDVLDQMSRFVRDQHGVEMVGALGFENTWAFAMRRADAEGAGIRTIADLTPRARQMTLGGDFEFFGRPEWKAIRDTYSLNFAGTRTMDPSLMYQAVDSKQVDVITAYSTDGRIAALDLALLDDNRQAIPPYDAVILVGPRLLREHPDVVAALRQLAGTIDADRMRKMNLAADQDGTSPAAVAESFLAELKKSGRP